ncbi:RNA 2'-phosphotransferase [Streptomyces sp. T7(2022)]|uniref:RNA 2'-phosphotransferase n=1 Tax=Streptomyces sp. T7(2022) TaxID=2916034 RepID=UPI001EE48934|nr:RNA 2'-phosphotransferase [Streptomyces sp. T7(2022)]MCG5122572.1 RNA 2'-phosphotransferase [Streptomyces sp. T7(2022)]
MPRRPPARRPGRDALSTFVPPQASEKDPPPPVEALTGLLEDRYPEVVRLLGWIGCGSPAELVTAWAHGRGAGWVWRVLDAESEPGQVLAAWKDVLRSDDQAISVLESLVFETNMGRFAARASTRMPGGMRYAKTLHVVRQRVALSLWEHALSVNWRRPVVFCRSLRLARTYLTAVVANHELTDEKSRFQFSGRLGQAAVLLARFEQVGTADLEASAEQFRMSVAEGNPAADAVPYLLECYLRLHDNSGDREYLGRAALTDREFADASRGPTWHLMMAEVWLRLADGSPRNSRFAFYLRNAEVSLVRAGEPGGGEAVQHALLPAVAAAARRAPALLPSVRLGLRRLNNPFGLGDHLRRFAEAGHPAVELPGVLVHDLRTRFLESGEPLHRRLLADCFRAYVQLGNLDGELENARLLHDALALQEGTLAKTTALTDELSRMRHADDLLALAELRDNAKRRLDGIALLIREAGTNTTSCVPLVRLGRTLEHGGRPLDEVARGQLRVRLGDVPGADRWIQAVVEGDPDFFYEQAAGRALSSPDLMRRNLGGRSNVVTIDDYLGFTDSTLVFKPTTRLCSDRDAERSAAVRETVRRMGAEEQFGVIDLITTISAADVAHSQEQFPSGTELISVRRFAGGTELAKQVSPTLPEQSCALLERTARFLAYMHGSDGASAGKQVHGVRKNVRKEARMWLRSVLPDEPSAAPGCDEVFDAWWALLAGTGLPPQPRRDAHAFNWLVTDTGQIVAVDLEASHHRPMGYELAQLTDDVPALPVDRWDLRRQVVTAYTEALAHCQGAPPVDGDKLWLAYRASLLIRAVRALSDRTGEPGIREHGEALLDELCSPHRDPGQPGGPEEESLSGLAVLLRNAWAERRGTPGGAPLRELKDGRRRRISKALAYHLRHSPHITRDASGWVEVGTLAHVLSPGIKVTAEEIVSVARALTETRFEVRGDCVRARYGHSRPAIVEYQERLPDSPLYHCTSSSALREIFERGEGLRPMSRQWVHLTTDRAAALATGRRHGPSVLLRVTDPAGLAWRHAGGNTWLAGHVPPEALSVVPLHQLFATHG